MQGNDVDNNVDSESKNTPKKNQYNVSDDKRLMRRRTIRYQYRKLTKYESAHSLNAYNLYRKLGPLRTLSHLAQITGMSIPTLSRWSKKYQWDKRIMSDQKKLALALACPELDNIVEMRERQAKIAVKGQNVFEKKLDDGRVDIDASDFVRLSEHEARLRGDPNFLHTERNDQTTSHSPIISIIVSDGREEKNPDDVVDGEIIGG